MTPQHPAQKAANVFLFSICVALALFMFGFPRLSLVASGVGTAAALTFAHLQHRKLR